MHVRCVRGDTHGGVGEGALVKDQAEVNAACSELRVLGWLWWRRDEEANDMSRAVKVIVYTRWREVGEGGGADGVRRPVEKSKMNVA